jgi:hypothetical protein
MYCFIRVNRNENGIKFQRSRNPALRLREQAKYELLSYDGA